MRLVVVEGNWLLLQEPGRADLRRHFDLRCSSTCPSPSSRAACGRAGYGLDEAAIRARLEDNDLPNARRVIEGSVPADVWRGTSGEGAWTGGACPRVVLWVSH